MNKKNKKRYRDREEKKKNIKKMKTTNEVKQ